MTQPEVAALLPRGDRDRVSAVERSLAQPNGGEILAYSLMFGFRPQDIFPAFYSAVEEAVIRHAYEFDQRLSSDTSLAAVRKRTLMGEMLGRATGKASKPIEL